MISSGNLCSFDGLGGLAGEASERVCAPPETGCAHGPARGGHSNQVRRAPPIEEGFIQKRRQRSSLFNSLLR